MRKPMFTVWVNAIEPTLVDASPVFQTWNPLYNPDPKTVLAQIPLQRAVVHAGTELAQKNCNNCISNRTAVCFFVVHGRMKAYRYWSLLSVLLMRLLLFAIKAFADL